MRFTSLKAPIFTVFVNLNKIHSANINLLRKDFASKINLNSLLDDQAIPLSDSSCQSASSSLPDSARLVSYETITSACQSSSNPIVLECAPPSFLFIKTPYFTFHTKRCSATQDLLNFGTPKVIYCRIPDFIPQKRFANNVLISSFHK